MLRKASLACHVAAVCAGVALLLGSGCAPPWQSSHPPAPGTIVFGFGIHRVSAHEIDIVKQRTVFYRGQSVAWVAYLKHRAGARSLTLSLLALTTHALVLNESVRKIKPAWIELANPGETVRGFEMLGVSLPGTYVMRYTRGNIVLAEGTIQLRR